MQDPPVAPSLRKFVSRGNPLPVARCDDEAAWLCGLFGIPRQGDWPSAPLSVFGSGMPPGNDFWLNADPVHLQVHRDRMILMAPAVLQVTDAEAVSLCAALNRHFAADQFEFLAPHPDRWYLKTSRPVRIHTRGLSRAVGQDVDHMLPEGEERLAWHRVFNEVQMLLHAHPVNEEREKRGALPINSLWFAGGGILPQAQRTFDAIVGSSAMVQGLAKLTETPFTHAVHEAGDIEGDRVLVEISGALDAFLTLDHEVWKKAIEDIEARWIVPLNARLRAGRLRRIELVTVSGGRCYQWSIGRAHLWRFWKPAMPLTDPLGKA